MQAPVTTGSMGEMKPLIRQMATMVTKSDCGVTAQPPAGMRRGAQPAEIIRMPKTLRRPKSQKLATSGK